MGRARADAEFLWGGHPQGPPGHNSGRVEGDAGCSELRALGQARRGEVRETVLRSAIGALLAYHATLGVMCTGLYLQNRTRKPGGPISRPLAVFSCNRQDQSRIGRGAEWPKVRRDCVADHEWMEN